MIAMNIKTKRQRQLKKIKVRSASSGLFYFVALAVLPALAAALRALSAALAGCLPTAPAGRLSDALKVRLRSRLAACDRLRVFSRALSFGMESSSPQFFRIENVLSACLHPTLWNCQNRRNCPNIDN